MSFFFGDAKKQKPQYTGLQTNSSTNDLPIPILYGQTRISSNLIGYSDFRHRWHEIGKDGKGGSQEGKGSGEYLYSASIMLAFCEGPITGIFHIWKDKYVFPAVNYNTEKGNTDHLGGSLTHFMGTTPQDAWSYYASAHPDQTLNYPGIAYTACANYDLGASNTLSNLNFEVQGILYNTAPWTGEYTIKIESTTIAQEGETEYVAPGTPNGDADFALVVKDFLTNPVYGAGFPESEIDLTQLLSTDAATTTGDNSYQTYCRAMGWGISTALTGQSAASEYINRWTTLTNTAVVWTGYKLRFIPYGDYTFSGNGVTFVPKTDIIYSLSTLRGDFLSGSGSEDPVETSRADPLDAHNLLKMTVKNRGNNYVQFPLDWNDQSSIEKVGPRYEQVSDASDICLPSVGQTMLSLIGQRKVYLRNKYKFKAPLIYSLVEPMDLLNLTDRGVTVTVRITEVAEQDDGSLEITAEEYPGHLAFTTPAYEPQGNVNGGVNTAVTPGQCNAPIIIEPPLDLTQGSPQLWVALSGASPYWGGATIYSSFDDITYGELGSIGGPSRMGVLSSGLSSYGEANPDNSHTCSVNLTQSSSTLESITDEGFNQGVTLCYCDGEFFTYKDAALVDSYRYNLTTLNRGLYNSMPGSHSTGDQFVRIDDRLFKYPLTSSMIGVTLYLKFVSHNVFGLNDDDLSGSTVYQYTPTGAAFAVAPPTNVTLTSVSVDLGNGSTTRGMQISWTASKGPYLDHYQVQLSTDDFATTIPVTSSGVETISIYYPVANSTPHRARVRSISSVPNSIPSAWVTSSSVTSGTATSGSTKVYFGSGAPSTLHSEGDLYYNTSTTPPTGYIQHSSAWIKLS
jgi:hypothetical protein